MLAAALVSSGVAELVSKKLRIVSSRPSWNTLRSAGFRPETYLPESSVTTKLTSTRSTRVRNIERGLDCDKATSIVSGIKHRAHFMRIEQFRMISVVLFAPAGDGRARTCQP